MKMERDDLKLFAMILIFLIFIVVSFGAYYVYYFLTFVPPEEIVINLSQLNLE